MNFPIRPTQRILYVLTALALVILCFFYDLELSPVFFPLDDPYITLHNAQVLHQGYDLNYPNVPALSGATSLVHLAWVTLLLFFLAPTTALLVTQWLAIFAYSFGLLRLAFIHQASWIQSILFLVAGTTTSYVAFHLLNGLETGLALASVTWLLVLVCCPRDSVERRWLFPILCGTAPFIRPELAIFSAILLVYHIAGEKPFSLPKGLQQLSVLRAPLLACLAGLPWLSWLWINTGLPYPRTMTAKLAYTAEATLPTWVKLKLVFKYFMGFLVSISYLGSIGACLLLCLTALGRCALLFAVIFASIYAYCSPTAWVFNAWRYPIILVPILLFGFASTWHHEDKLIRRGSQILLLLLACQACWFFPSCWHDYQKRRHYFFVQLNDVAHWCQQHLPPDTAILVHDAGYIAFATSFRLVDQVGLKTPDNIRFHQQLTLPSAGKDRGKAISRIIQINHLKYIIVLEALENQVQVAQSLRALGWQLKPLHVASDAYTIYRIEGQRVAE